tara:strand:+ start:90 stop:947 length:858 start_codon:yes stop_codon:yes gene_type:complete
MNNKGILDTILNAGLSEDLIFNLSDYAQEAALRGGNVLKENYGNYLSIKNKGRVGDLVTNVDTEAEERIIEYLQEVTPEIGIIAEESGIRIGHNNMDWCIDPLDGTTNYAHGYPFFATSIGLLLNNRPILGAIYIPFFNEIYVGIPFKGSFCNNQKIQVSNCLNIKDSLLVTGFAYDRHTQIDNNYAEFCHMTHLSRGVRRAGAAAVDLCFVACGRVDAYWERGLAKWDLAAGIPIVELAGGSVLDYKKNYFNIDEGRVVATSPSIEKELIKRLNEVKPLDPINY